MLVRDRAAGGGLEVCLMQRNLNSDFVGGAYVFPGGGLDPEDSDVRLALRCRGLDDTEASRRLDLGSGGLAYWFATVREAFEEAGVLLAGRADGLPVGFDDPTVAERFERHRGRVDRSECTLLEVLEEEDLVVDGSTLHYFARWITPLGAPRRYDTRFFLAAAPETQEVRQDDRELIGTAWMRPGEALARHEAGEITMIFPTIRTLVALDRFDSSGAALAHAAAVAEVPAVLPTLVESAHGLRIRLPGDPEGTGGLYDAFTGLPAPE
jgi:8-oxo-dGTP pyrophosphatase MutT (NUDIX family)